MSITKATCPGWLRISLIRSFRPALGRVNPPREVSGQGGMRMVEADQLIFNPSSRTSQVWVAQSRDSLPGEMVIHPAPALVPTGASNSAQTAKCEIAVFEGNLEGPTVASSRLWLAGLFTTSGSEILDATGKMIGGWQGEWLRVFNHPAGRVIAQDIRKWCWISPAGNTLASWQMMPQDAWRIEFSGLDLNQAFCRLVALLKAGEMVARVRTGPK